MLSNTDVNVINIVIFLKTMRMNAFNPILNESAYRTFTLLFYDLIPFKEIEIDLSCTST